MGKLSKGKGSVQEYLSENFHINYENTDQGVRVEFQPKDPGEVKGFQAAVQYMSKLCKRCCCAC